MVSKEMKYKKLSRALVKHKGNQTKAYMEVYPNASKSSATHRASVLLAKNPEIKENAIAIIEKQGLTKEYLAKKLKKLTNHKKEIIRPDGSIIKVKDGNIQLDATKTALKMQGMLAERTVEQDNRSVTINMSGDHLSGSLNSLTHSLLDLNTRLKLSESTQNGELDHAKTIRPDEVIDAEIVED